MSVVPLFLFLAQVGVAVGHTRRGLVYFTFSDNVAACSEATILWQASSTPLTLRIFIVDPATINSRSYDPTLKHLYSPRADSLVVEERDLTGSYYTWMVTPPVGSKIYATITESNGQVSTSGVVRVTSNFGGSTCSETPQENTPTLSQQSPAANPAPTNRSGYTPTPTPSATTPNLPVIIGVVVGVVVLIVILVSAWFYFRNRSRRSGGKLAGTLDMGVRDTS